MPVSEVKTKVVPNALLFTLLFAGQIASTMFLPGLPELAIELNVSRSLVQTMVPTYLAAFAISQLMIGPLSDKYGRKPIVLLGIIIFTLASFFCAIANDIQTLLFCRVAQATGACSTLVISRAIIRDTSDGLEAAKAMAILTIAMAVGPIIAPFLGGFLNMSLAPLLGPLILLLANSISFGSVSLPPFTLCLSVVLVKFISTGGTPLKPLISDN